MWFGLGGGTLVVVAMTLAIGVPVYRQQCAIRDIARLGGTCSTKHTAPEWARGMFGEEVVRRFEPVWTVFFQEVDLHDEDLSVLARVPHVERLWLYGLPLTDKAFAQMRQLRSLRELELVSLPITGEGFADLQTGPPIESVFVFDCPLTDSGFRELTRLPGLKKLSLLSGGRPGDAPVRITDARLAQLAAIPSLTELTIDAGEIDDRRLATICAMRGLTHLTLHNPDITDAGLLELSRLTRLERLSLDGARGISDGGLGGLGALHKLWSLDIKGTCIGDDGLRRIAGFRDEESPDHEDFRPLHVDVSNTLVTDAGVRDFKSRSRELSVRAGHLRPWWGE
jgi:hypothetical protein